ncbi:competence protein CoiA family protein [Streptomyces sp. NBC_00424]|uniref:competence protein CoiA n=1 Tax=Streptomyces sp. NBC_00424 TaxID=2903648 RepID=UPI0022597E3A|nr:competence protein CoiA family protein [Streptomyces sp. NBC_00424]MCX5078763.1 competence protein CoiA family protein [Streptomyces sp. NBC_00424]
MGYTAVHQDWGRLDASLDDLGCGRSWRDVHRVPGMELACPECRGRVFARISQHRSRHFYHQARPDNCELANESPEHHRLKRELAMAARAAGWRAELEVAGATGNWRADVMVFDEQGHAFMALEAQLSPMTPDEARMRTERYAADGVAVCWVGPQERPWQRVVPTLRVPFPAEDDRVWQVRHGMASYVWAPRTLKAKAAWVHITCPLGDALKWILEGRVHVHTEPNGTVWWTAPAYQDLAVARARLEAGAEASARAAAAEKAQRQEEQRRREADARAAALKEWRRNAAARSIQAELERLAELQRLAGFFEHAGIDAAMWRVFTQMVRSTSGKTVVYGDQSPSHGNGLLVYTRPREWSDPLLAGVVCPAPEGLIRWPGNLTILVPGPTWLARIQAAPRPALQVAVLDPVTGRSDFVKVAASHQPEPIQELPRSGPTG